MNATLPSMVNTPEPPYVAVIFSSLRTEGDNGYADMARVMFELASAQPGFLGAESVRDGLGITVSYWTDLDAVRTWYEVAAHREAQALGISEWYESYSVRIARVERAYGRTTRRE